MTACQIMHSGRASLTAMHAACTPPARDLAQALPVMVFWRHERAQEGAGVPLQPVLAQAGRALTRGRSAPVMLRTTARRRPPRYSAPRNACDRHRGHQWCEGEWRGHRHRRWRVRVWSRCKRANSNAPCSHQVCAPPSFCIRSLPACQIWNDAM